jgi:hypothetical protein
MGVGLVTGRAASWVFAAVVATASMMAPHLITGVVLFAALVALIGWVGWCSLAEAVKAVDDRADLVPHVPRRMPRIPDRVRHAQLPPAPVIPRPRALPPEVLPPGAVVVPGAIRGWLRPPGKD